jgi:ankyrin repeat protein
MNYASMYGHLETVKYLHSIGGDSTLYAIDWASACGHLEIVKYLHSIGNLFSKYAIDNAKKKQTFRNSPVFTTY